MSSLRLTNCLGLIPALGDVIVDLVAEDQVTAKDIDSVTGTGGRCRELEYETAESLSRDRFLSFGFSLNMYQKNTQTN